MTADEIRKAGLAVDAACKGPEMEKLSAEDRLKAVAIVAGAFAFSMACEGAAQLAQLNVNLVKLTPVLEANSSGGQFDVKVWER